MSDEKKLICAFMSQGYPGQSTVAGVGQAAITVVAIQVECAKDRCALWVKKEVGFEEVVEGCAFKFMAAG